MLRDCAPSKSGCGRASRWLCGFELALQWDGRFSSEKRPKLRRSVPTHACTTPATHTHRRPGNTRTGAEAPDQRPKECPPGGRRDWFKPNAPIYIECTSRGDIPPPLLAAPAKTAKHDHQPNATSPIRYPPRPSPSCFCDAPPASLSYGPAQRLSSEALSLSLAQAKRRLLRRLPGRRWPTALFGRLGSRAHLCSPSPNPHRHTRSNSVAPPRCSSRRRGTAAYPPPLSAAAAGRAVPRL